MEGGRLGWRVRASLHSPHRLPATPGVTQLHHGQVDGAENLPPVQLGNNVRLETARQRRPEDPVAGGVLKSPTQSADNPGLPTRNPHSPTKNPDSPGQI